MPDYYIGLMSGTSLDGADGVLIDFSSPRLQVVAAASEPFSPAFRAELLALNSPTDNELHRAALAANQVSSVYAGVVAQLLQAVRGKGISAGQISAIGAHGQTVRHQPQRVGQGPEGSGYTLQLINAALLAELSGIDVVADFRSRDVAAGGQGAPLVPAFHEHMFGQTGSPLAVLNLGGIANLSALPGNAAGESVSGFDCGPGNALIDAWCQQHTGQTYDAGGSWAASGKLLPALLASLQDDPYFSQPPPKSTGRDLFSLTWLGQKLAAFGHEVPRDIQNTLTEFTASTCASAINRYAKHSKEVIVCGGGALNGYLIGRLQALLPDVKVTTSDRHGLPVMEVEAAAFAWLARLTLRRQPGNLPAVTGAAGLRILGALYPGGHSHHSLASDTTVPTTAC